MQEQIVDKISEIFRIKKDLINDTTRIEEIVKDSMGIVELLAVLSADYGVAIEPKALNDIYTVGDIVKYVEEHRGELSNGDSLNSF